MSLKTRKKGIGNGELVHHIPMDESQWQGVRARDDGELLLPKWRVLNIAVDNFAYSSIANKFAGKWSEISAARKISRISLNAVGVGL